MKKILCADIGTTSLKVAVIDSQGKVVSFSKQIIKVQDISLIAKTWQTCFEKGVFECTTGNQNNQSHQDFDAICISGNGPTVVTCSGRTVLWNQAAVSELNCPSLFLPKLAKLKKLYPEEWKNSQFILSGPEFLIYCLTKKAVTILPEERFLPAYWDESQLSCYGFSKEDEKKLPKFVKPGYQAGTWNGIPVICGGPDFVCALIGTNTLESGKLCDRAGSSEGINLCTNKPVFASGIRTLPSIIPNLYNLSVLIEKSGSLINHFRTDINLIEKQKNTFSQIFEYCYQDKNSEGYRILCQIKDEVRNAVNLLKDIAKKNNLKFIPKMTVTGGQAKNAKWILDKAQAAKIDLYVTNCPDSELLGDAVIAQVALNEYKTLQEAANAMVHETKTFKNNDFEFTTSQKQNKENFNPNGDEQLSSKMKVFKIPKDLKTIIFDIDSTLYTNEAYAIEQVDVQIRFWAKKVGLSEAQARNKISEFRRNWSKEHEGKRISLGNTFTHFGISIEESIKMRNELVDPFKFLKKDEKLISVLSKLSKKYALICVTNNPILPARKTLEALGVEKIIPNIIALDTCGKSKPAKENLELACSVTNCTPEQALSVGDRYEIDLRLPLEMGMGAILVSGVKDIYKLTEIL